MSRAQDRLRSKTSQLGTRLHIPDQIPGFPFVPNGRPQALVVPAVLDCYYVCASG